MNNEQNSELWEIAKKRANFKRSLVTYLAVNLMLVAIWFFSSGPYSYFWPIWAMLGWGLGIVLQYVSAYHGYKLFSADREYEKLSK